jgi:hypothetical protein
MVMAEYDGDIDEVLGIVRCARCGHRLNGEIECPFCSLFPDPPRKRELPTWVYFTACFLTSPLSLYAIARSTRLSAIEKVVASAGFLFWGALYLVG